jgi:hypothetical protein
MRELEGDLDFEADCRQWVPAFWLELPTVMARVNRFHRGGPEVRPPAAPVARECGSSASAPGVLSRLRRFARFAEASRLAANSLRVICGEYRQF